MIEKLTKHQEKLLADLNEKRVNTFYNFGKVDEEKVRQSVYKFYGYANLKTPEVEFFDFSKPHLGSKYISAVDSAVHSAVRSAVRSAVDSAVDSAVRSAVDSAVDSAVGSAVRSAVGSAVGSAVRSAVDSAVDSAVRSAVGSAVGSAVDSAVYYSFGFYRWYREDWYVTYREFFSKILPNFPLELFEEFKKANDAGFLYYFMFEKVCFVVKMPEKIDQWVGEGYNRRLHSDTKEAINISGLKLFFLNGVQFKEELWSKVVSKKMAFEEILAIPDVDQRNQALRYVGREERDKFLKMVKAEVIDTYQKSDINGNKINYKLYKIPRGDIFNKEVYYMWYECPSTGNDNFSGVPEFKTVPEAMSWKSSSDENIISPEDWINSIPLQHES